MLMSGKVLQSVIILRYLLSAMAMAWLPISKIVYTLGKTSWISYIFSSLPINMT